MDILYNTEELLPKCWVKKIIKYWEKIMPTDYPKSSSTFSFVTTQEDKEAVAKMERELGTEDSIIDPDDIPYITASGDTAIGVYLGTYDVVADTDVLTLLSPEKLPNDAVNAMAYHYTEKESWDPDTHETTTEYVWELIEDIEIKDGYVYGQLEEFSPIAVFSVRRESYINNDIVICNGIASKIYTEMVTEDDETIYAVYLKNAYGTTIVIPEGSLIVGGAFNEPIESSNITVYGVNDSAMDIIGGSYGEGTEDKCICNVVNVNIINSTINSVHGTLLSSAFNVNINVDNSTINIVDNGIYEFTSSSESEEAEATSAYKNTSIEDAKLKLAANQWVKDSTVTISNNSIVNIAAAGSYVYNNDLKQNTFGYTETGKIYGYNSKINSIISQYNGVIDNCIVEIENCTIDGLVGASAHGIFGNGKTVLKGNNNIITGCILGVDASESYKSDAIITGKLSCDINKGTVIDHVVVGAVNSVTISDPDVVANYVKYYKVSRDADLTYENGAKAALKKVLVIK